jgi:hypothetical protein
MMAAILTIGRIGMDVVLPNPQGFSEHGDGGQVTLSLNGQIKDCTSLADAIALKEELLAQVGRIVPVTYTTDASIDGFYTLNSANVNTDRAFAPYSNYLFPFTVELSRIDSPTWEMTYTGGVIPNAHTITATADKGMVAIPVSFAWAADPTGAVTSATVNADGDDVRIYYALDPGDTGPEYAIAPADFYDGACEIWVDSRLRAGSNRRLPAFSTIMLTNKLAKAEVSAAIANGDIDISHYDGTAWRKKDYNLRWDSATNENGAWTQCHIIRNDPEEVSVQFVKPRATVGFLAMTVTLRRGWRTILITLFTDGALDCGINRKTSEAGSAISTYGVVATSADANGHKYLLLTPQAISTVDLGSTAGFETTGNAATIFIGVSLVLASPESGTDQTSLIDQFFNWLETAQFCRGVAL